MSHDITLSFDTSTLKPHQGTPTDFTVEFQRPIDLGSLLYSVSLVKLATWYSIYNFSSVEHSNTIFNIDDGTDNVDITIPNGIYSFEDFNSYITPAIISEFGSEVVKFEVNDNTGKFVITLAANVTLIISNGSASNFGLVDRYVDGWDKTSVSYSAGGSGQVIESTFTPQWTNGIQSMNLECDLTSNSSLNGKSSSIIAQFAPRGAPFGSIIFEPKNLVFSQVNKKNFNRIRIKLTDQSGNLIDLNGENMSLMLIIRKM